MPHIRLPLGLSAGCLVLAEADSSNQGVKLGISELIFPIPATLVAISASIPPDPGIGDGAVGWFGVLRNASPVFQWVPPRVAHLR